MYLEKVGNKQGFLPSNQFFDEQVNEMIVHNLPIALIII